jgi:hypothetical protein
VRRGSDIDIAIELLGTSAQPSVFHYEKAFAAKDLTVDELGITPVTFEYSVEELKNDVHAAMRSAFGASAVRRSDKCIKIRERATTLPADVVPCRTHRRYDSRYTSHDGIEIRPDSGGTIVNWPRQDDENGTDKNKPERTGTRYKRAVRGIKSLENEMVDNGAITPGPSFMMECAVYNVPDGHFSKSSNFQNCLAVLSAMARAAQDGSYSDWEELNGLKYLFRGVNSWSVEDMIRLVTTAADYIKAG